MINPSSSVNSSKHSKFDYHFWTPEPFQLQYFSSVYYLYCSLYQSKKVYFSYHPQFLHFILFSFSVHHLFFHKILHFPLRPFSYFQPLSISWYCFAFEERLSFGMFDFCPKYSWSSMSLFEVDSIDLFEHFFHFPNCIFKLEFFVKKNLLMSLKSFDECFSFRIF